MNYRLLFRTINYITLKQLYYQVRCRLIKFKYSHYSSPVVCGAVYQISSTVKYTSLTQGVFDFLNLSRPFINWNDTSHRMLWAYNLNYMDWLGQEGMTYEEGAEWIDGFINDLSANKVGLDPYPIALRGINWIKFICKHREQIDGGCIKRWNDSLYSQYKLLEKKIEWHLMGNHLLEDACSLYIASIYFNDEKMFRRYSALLRAELKEQILNDGAHYEQSPMYHCILLDRLLDCCNFSFHNDVFDGQSVMNDHLRHYAGMMLGHLEGIIYSNGDIPLLNDSAYGIAPTSDQLFEYAERLGIEWSPKQLKECGYRHWITERFEAIIDIGNVAASYQPGHTHADTFNYEMRIGGRPFVVDTGISTYEKNSRRQYERSTMAHNTVTVNGMDSSEVWGGFRVGKRASVKVYADSEDYISASHNGFKGVTCKRDFVKNVDGITIRDILSKDIKGKSYLHLAPGVQVIDINSHRIITSSGVIQIANADMVEVSDDFSSTEYNKILPIKKICFSFTGNLQYTIIA